MSEYQYYEFAALEHALDQRQLGELRAISTRAQITPTSFVNTYEWGDLKADPRVLVERYFDALLYLSNWGTHRLMLRFPIGTLDAEPLDHYFVGDAASSWQTGVHTIIDLTAVDEDGAFEEDWSDGAGEGRLASIVPARAEALAGDHRLLYLAWLLCVQAGEVADEATEPAVPPNLASLSGSLQSVASFLRIDDDLLTVAARASNQHHIEMGVTGKLDRWLATIPASEQSVLLARVAHGSGQQVQTELQARFRRTLLPASSDPRDRRTAGELLELTASRRHDRERTTLEHRKRTAADRERAETAAYERRLSELADHEEESWSRVDALIQERNATSYTVAAALLSELAEVCRRAGRGGKLRTTTCGPPSDASTQDRVPRAPRPSMAALTLCHGNGWGFDKRSSGALLWEASLSW